jgi:hypothetical protein
VAVAHDIGQAEVGDLDVHLAVEQQVLRLQVPAAGGRSTLSEHSI